MKHLWFAIAALAALTTPARADDGDAASALARLAASEPPVAETVAAALRHAGLDDHPEHRLARRAHLAGLLPTITLRAHRDAGWSDGDGRIVGDVQRDDYVEARATWRLDRIVFDTTDVRVESLARERARARDALASQVIDLYYKRRELAIERLWHPAQDSEADARQAAMLDELTAQLDSVTGGWWSAGR